MDVGALVAYLSVAATICTLVGFWIGRKKEAKQEGTKEGSLWTDIEYIKRRTDDVLLEQKDTNKSLSALGERMARNEESTKQAHKRIDKLEDILKKEE